MDALIQAIAQAVKARGTKSTALHSIMWALGVVLLPTVGAVYFKAETWVVIVFLGFASILLLLFVIAFVFFMLTNPDALRSERFALDKMQIEKQFVGDQTRGLVERPASEPAATIPAPLPEGTSNG